MNSILWKNEGRNQTKTRVREDSILCIETSTKNSVQEFYLCCPLFFISFSTRLIDEFPWTFPIFTSDPFDKQCATEQGRRFSQSAICLGAVSVWHTDDRLCWVHFSTALPNIKIAPFLHRFFLVNILIVYLFRLLCFLYKKNRYWVVSFLPQVTP